MEQIDEKDFKKAKSMPPLESEKGDMKELSDADFKTMLEEMDNPVLAQKKIAVQIKHFLDNKIASEMKQNKTLSESTRRWIESYNSILEKIQKAMHGDKSVNLNIHAISHADIAARIRDSEKY
jgi:hypothetical protein